jgi:hypothetical protein
MIHSNFIQHPFQNDPGTSQRQRVVDELLSGNSKIDGRTIADLLAHFSALSRHINFPDKALHMSDWQPFFRASAPFVLVEIIRFDQAEVLEKFSQYIAIFHKNPGSHSAQLLIHFIYHQLLKQIDTWHLSLSGSELPVRSVMDKLIQEKLALPVRKFICLTNVTVQELGINRLDFHKLAENKIWNLTQQDIRKSDCVSTLSFDTINAKEILADEITALFSSFLNMIGLMSSSAELSMEQSLFPLKEELQEKHTPHLALLFAFLKLFQHLQQDLNTFSKKHLDFFYKDVLKLKPRAATPDNAHVIIEIQKQLEKYLLKKGTEFKGGKDINKEEIHFSADEEIVINKAEVAQIKTLHLNQHILKAEGETGMLEGVYIAPDVRKADGLTKDFKDNDPKNWATLGSKLSKYLDPETKQIKPYRSARLGFILASPVLLLREGERKIDIKLACRFDDAVCPISKNEINTFFDNMQYYLDNTYYYINRELIAEATKRGLGKEIIEKFKSYLSTKKDSLCKSSAEKNTDNVVTQSEVLLYEKVVLASELTKDFSKIQLDSIADIFRPFRIFNILFSGEDGWIGPMSTPRIFISRHEQDTNFVLYISLTLQADKPAITFFDALKLKETYNTELPVVKIELDDRIKYLYQSKKIESECVFNKNTSETEYPVSLYQFFRNVFVIPKIEDREWDKKEEKIIGKKGSDFKTEITVSVCGLKNFIVQWM